MSDTPMSAKQLAGFRCNLINTPHGLSNQECHTLLDEIKRLQELVDELGEVLYAKYLTHQRVCQNNAWPDTWTQLLIRAGKLKKEDVV